MSFHRNQAQFVRARWRPVILFPVWIFQAVLLLAILGIFTYRLAETAEHFSENRAAGKVPTVDLVWEVANVSLGVLCLVLTILEVTRLLAETLTPFFLLAAHVIKMTCAAAILALDIIVYINRSEGNWSSVGLALDVALLTTIAVLFAYAIVTYRRLLLAYDDFHHPANNTKTFGLSNDYDDIELNSPLVSNSAGTSVGSAGVANGDVVLRTGPYQDSQTEYDPSRATEEAKGTCGPSHLVSSRLGRLSQSVSAAVAPPASSMPDDGRQASYSHERDTQFDSYVKSRTSTGLRKDEIDQAISTELWGSMRPPLTAAGGNRNNGAIGVVNRSSSVVATGTVASHHTISATDPYPEAINRMYSWSVDHGQVSVPESVNEHDEILLHGQYRTKGTNKDRALLTGHSRNVSLDDEEYDKGNDEQGPVTDIEAREHA